MILLPENILNCHQLTSHHKRLLADFDSIPLVNPAFDNEVVKNIIQYFSLTPDIMEEEMYKYAARLLDENKVDEAWQVLLTNI